MNEKTDPAVPVIDKNKNRKRILIQNSIAVGAAYVMGTGYQVTANYLGLANMSRELIVLIALPGFIFTLVSVFILLLKKEITLAFANLIHFSQFLVWLVVYYMWVLHLWEIRFITLFVAATALLFIILNSTLILSILLSLTIIAVQLAGTLTGYYFLDQPVNLVRELFIVGCYFPASIIISFIASQIHKKKNVIRVAKKEIENMNEELYSAKVEVDAAMEELEAINENLIETNSTLEQARHVMERDMKMASQVQSSFFMKNPPRNREWEIAFTFKPMSGVSGDLYDLYYQDDTLVGAGLFDVSGHGIASGLLTLLARSIIFNHFMDNSDLELGDVVDGVNRSLIREMRGLDSYITGVLLRFKDEKVEYVNAGHPDLLIKSSVDGRVSPVMPDSDVGYRGHFLGIEIMQNPFPFQSVTVRSNDFLLLYSDCLIETRNSTGKAYGMERLKKSMESFSNEISVDDALDILLNDFYNFAGNKELSDDLTAILLKKI